MTGFGRGEYVSEKLSLTVEIKTVNHRYNEIALRMPRALNPLEDRVRKQITDVISRGRVDVFVNMADSSANAYEMSVDKELAASYNNALSELARTLELESDMSGAMRLAFLLRFASVINAKETIGDADFYLPFLSGAVAAALANLMKMRLAEGANIYKDLLPRIKTIKDKLAEVQERAPAVTAEFHAKIRERVAELLKDYEQAVDQDKILHEVALFADRTNITEEIVRLGSHIKQFEETFAKKIPVGRKLDFIVQEFNREVNTIASKANDFAIAQMTVEMKSEIEKIREQIQNIE
jgi:uncharacterized protein (TIGR00255 family)